MLQVIINKVNKMTGYNYQLESLVDGKLNLIHTPEVQPSAADMVYGATPNPIERICVGFRYNHTVSGTEHTIHEIYGRIICWLNKEERTALADNLYKSNEQAIEDHELELAEAHFIKEYGCGGYCAGPDSPKHGVMCDKEVK